MIFKEYLRFGIKMRGECVKLKKNDRWVVIKEVIELNFFIIDYELCEKFDVSI